VRNRRNRRLLAALFAVCFLVGTCAVLLSGCSLPDWLTRLWGGGGPDDETIVIYPGQVLKVPRPAGTGTPPPLPNPPVAVSKVASGSGRVALTFDAGWEFAPTLPLLQVLKDHGLQVTFFPRGKWLEDHPDLAAAIRAGGHEIGSHSYTHPYMTQLPVAEMEAELSKAKQALVNVLGADAFIPLYRPPYGDHNATVSASLAKNGYGYVVMWQVDSLDWKEPGVDAIVKLVLEKVTDGGIVLMHLGTMQTVEALPRILAALEERKLSVVRVTDLLGLHETQGGTTVYTVKAGDTLFAIAQRHSTTVAALLQLNPELKK
jgi:peptidoglycan/xylan/chitin deacetylase (PgdA/CDA1 family)